MAKKTGQRQPILHRPMGFCHDRRQFIAGCFPVSAGSLAGSNINNVQISDGTGTYAHSPITISGAPSGAVVTKIDYTFLIQHSDGRDLDVDLNDNTRTSAFRSDLWRGSYFSGGTDAGVNPVRVGTITSGPLIGLPVNQTWYLAAADSFSGDSGDIGLWSITLYWADVNRRPGTPSNVEPADGANVNTLMPTLRGSAYTDPDGDAHYKTWWEIAEFPTMPPFGTATGEPRT